MARRAGRAPCQVRDTPGASGTAGPYSLPLSRPCVYTSASALLIHWDLGSKQAGIHTGGRLFPKREPPSGF